MFNRNKTSIKKENKRKKRRELIEMYDMIAANLLAGSSIITNDEELDRNNIKIGFNSIYSEEITAKYFIIRSMPDYIKPRILDDIRRDVIQRRKGVKVNFYIHGAPHNIEWTSQEMVNRMSIWRKYSEQQRDNVNAFEYRDKRSSILAKKRIVLSTKYLNEAELDNKRSTCKIYTIIEINARNNKESILNMEEAIKALKTYCAQSDVTLTEIKVNLLDWMQVIEPCCLRDIKEVNSKIPKKIATDDIVAMMGGYKQGAVGKSGIVIAMDINSKLPITRKFKLDPDAAENWLIGAETQGGKSYFVKYILSNLVEEKFYLTIMDYEGDEYNYFAEYAKAANPDDARIISVGSNSKEYFDSMIIQQLTGDEEIDAELKETAISYTIAQFKIMAHGLTEPLNQYEHNTLSKAIKRVYDRAGVTEDRSTWYKSESLRIKMVYDEVKSMVSSGEMLDEQTNNIKHKKISEMLEALSVFFEEDGTCSSVYSNPISINEINKAKIVVFSFGMRGLNSSQIDPKILALKQLCVANVSMQRSNYCKYTIKTFNVKVWEEYQRWGDVVGSAETVGNAITGGRKRGDVNFIITNDVASIIDETNPVNARINQNISNMAIGRVSDETVRQKLCEKKSMMELKKDLDKIALSSNKLEDKEEQLSKNSKYQFAFCIVQDTGKKAIGKAMLPDEVKKSSIFKTGVRTEEKK